MLNLFGEEQEPDKKTFGVYKRFRKANHYGVSINEKKCKNCKYMRTFDYNRKLYHKCELQGISHSEASDVRLSYICDLWVTP